MYISKTTQNIIIWAFKLLFFILCGWYIFDKISVDGFQFSYFLHPTDFIVFTLLMLLNWSLEAHKWKYLIRKTENISFLTSIKATLAGLSFGLLTPNRLGNFVGKVLYLQPQNRIEGSLYAMYGNMAQMISTFLFGSFCFVLTYENYYPNINLIMAALPLVFTILLTLLFLFPDRIQLSFLNKVFSGSFLNSINGLQNFQGKTNVLFFALIRHLVFTMQYLLVLSYAPNFSFWEVFMTVQMIFFLTTMIPGLIFGKMMVRGPVAVFVLGTIGISTSFALNAVLFIWMINIALPSLFGSFLFLIKKRA